MFSAVVSMPVETEQTSLKVVPSDGTESETMSFAKSFDESAAASGLEMQRKTTADQTGKEMEILKHVPGAGIDDVPVGPTEVRPKPFSDQILIAIETIKSTAVAKSPVISAAAPVSFQPKQTVGSTQEEIAPATTLHPAEGLPKPAEGGGMGDVVKTYPVCKSVDVATPPMASVSKDLAVQKPPEVAGKPELVASTKEGKPEVIVSSKGGKPEPVAPGKKTTKSQDQAIELKVSLKSADVTQQVAGMEAQVVIPALIQTATPVETQKNGASNSPKVGAGSLITATSGQGVRSMTAPADSKGFRESIHAAKAVTSDAQAPIAVADDEGSSSSPKGDAKKAADLFASGGFGGVEQSQSIGSTAGTLAHAAGNPTVSMPGHVTEITTTLKVSPAEVSAHASPFQAESGEQDGSAPTALSAMDSAHRTLLVTPTTLEVGVTNGTHGWLKIRAEMTGDGAVNATLSSASAAGQEMLHRELPSLAVFLQGERVLMNSVVVHPPIAELERRDFAGAADGERHGQAQQDGSQGGGEERQGVANPSSDSENESMSRAAFSGAGDRGLSTTAIYAEGGSWLSVRA